MSPVDGAGIRVSIVDPTRLQFGGTADSGTGARKYGGRFNSPGTPLVYTADSLALAILELLVRVNARRRVAETICIPVSFPESLITVYEASDLPEEWDSRPYDETGQQVGDIWIDRLLGELGRDPRLELCRMGWSTGDLVGMGPK